MSKKSTDPLFLIMASYVLDPADVEAYQVLAGRMAIAAVESPGCAFLHAAQDVNDPNTFHLFEGWNSQQAFNEHLATEGFQAILKQALAMRIVSRSGTRFGVSESVPLDMPS